MSECNKKTFNSKTEANNRAQTINNDNKKNKGQKKLLRAYKCPDCELFHLSSMTKHNYRFVNDIDYRNNLKEEQFIKREGEHWEEYFKKKFK